MKYSIRITRQALAHLREIRRYIEEELAAPDAALNTIRAIRTEIAKLSYMPQKIQTIDEQPWKDEGFRRIRVKNYYVYFWIDEVNSKVQITSIIYVAREQANQLILMKME